MTVPTTTATAMTGPRARSRPGDEDLVSTFMDSQCKGRRPNSPAATTGKRHLICPNRMPISCVVGQVANLPDREVPLMCGTKQGKLGTCPTGKDSTERIRNGR